MVAFPMLAVLLQRGRCGGSHPTTHSARRSESTVRLTRPWAHGRPARTDFEHARERKHVGAVQGDRPTCLSDDAHRQVDRSGLRATRPCGEQTAWDALVTSETDTLPFREKAYRARVKIRSRPASSVRQPARCRLASALPRASASRTSGTLWSPRGLLPYGIHAHRT